MHDQDHVEAEEDKNVFWISIPMWKISIVTCLVGISLYLSSPSGGTPISFWRFVLSSSYEKTKTRFWWGKYF